jgi:peptide-methionine (S)-S-oxide reductase
MKRFLLLPLLAMMSSAPHAAGQDQTVSNVAIVGGGCFWCVESTYKLVPGITGLTSGYSGGKTKDPTYEDICTGETGHAEVVKVEFDPAVISYRKVLDLFFEMHDPTTITKEDMTKYGKFIPKGTPYQGNDYGTQYRSIIMYATEQEKKHAEEAKAAAQKDWKDPIVTEIVPVAQFYPAEEYHQDFADRNPNQGYVRGVVVPKTAKFRSVLEKKGEKIADPGVKVK